LSAARFGEEGERERERERISELRSENERERDVEGEIKCIFVNIQRNGNVESTLAFSRKRKI
jgi:hypothetical protein